MTERDAGEYARKQMAEQGQTPFEVKHIEDIEIPNQAKRLIVEFHENSHQKCTIYKFYNQWGHVMMTHFRKEIKPEAFDDVDDGSQGEGE